jgi:spore maturation protein CgeB
MMLKSKIIVVSQRDGWEDHYRLMEAIVSGAMIMTDSMLSLPDGYQDGISIVEYDSARDLKDKVTYYLQHTSERQSIAAKGRRLAMTKHRSWHRMEELIFGTILTNCHPPPQNENGNSNGNTSTSSASACPFVINAC